jgi:WD40 repeat protein
VQTILTAVSRLAKSFLRTVASTSTPHLYITSLATEFSTNPDIPWQWKSIFPGVPQIRCSGVSNHGGVLAHISVGSEVICVGVSRDGTRVVSGSSDGLVRIWDTSTGAEVRTLEGHTGWVLSVAFSADGTRIVSGSYDKSVRIWDASTGAEVHTLEGHTISVRSVAFSADGTRIVSGSSDNSVRIWDASTGAEVRTLEGHTDVVIAVAFSADGTRIVSGSGDKSVRIWDPEEVQHLDWEVGSKGWVVTKFSQRRLLWLPSQIHVCLQNRHCAVMISQNRILYNKLLQCVCRSSLGTLLSHG